MLSFYALASMYMYMLCSVYVAELRDWVGVRTTATAWTCKHVYSIWIEGSTDLWALLLTLCISQTRIREEKQFISVISEKFFVQKCALPWFRDHGIVPREQKSQKTCISSKMTFCFSKTDHQCAWYVGHKSPVQLRTIKRRTVVTAQLFYLYLFFLGDHLKHLSNRAPN